VPTNFENLNKVAVFKLLLFLTRQFWAYFGAGVWWK